MVGSGLWQLHGQYKGGQEELRTFLFFIIKIIVLSPDVHTPIKEIQKTGNMIILIYFDCQFSKYGLGTPPSSEVLKGAHYFNNNSNYHFSPTSVVSRLNGM